MHWTETLAVAVVTWVRPRCLRDCLASVRATLPTFRDGFVIANHPASLDDVDIETFHPVRSGRPPEHAGNLSQSWNLAMLWAFRDPATQWLLCLQDDMELAPGWVDLIGDEPVRDLYIAPAGDKAFLFNRRILRDVGWYDECFTTIGFQEWDWQARACRAVAHDRLSIEDQHGWSLNPVGLSRFWSATPPDHGLYDQTWHPRNFAWMQAKWGCNLNGTIPHNVPSPRCDEIEWYPWFPRG